MYKKILNLLPFLALVGISIYTVIIFLTDSYIASWPQYLAFVLLIANGAVYFYQFKYGVLGTGVLLVVAMFARISFFPWIATWGIRIVIDLPKFEPNMLGLFVLYFLLNFNMLMNWYLDVKEAGRRR